MFPTVARLSKASRRPLTTKRGNKDYYKGTRQAFLPGGLRTGAPGKHVIGGKAKYRLIDEQVRVFVAPPLEELLSSPLKPYVSVGVFLSKKESRAAFGRFRGSGLSPEHLLRVARQKTVEEPEPEKKRLLSWPSILTPKKAQNEAAVVETRSSSEGEVEAKVVPEAVLVGGASTTSHPSSGRAS
ncbi:hypothetical protein D9615_002630 [Tricholomella constricta]|uniref:Uncharacterized protein n=1 Tax=Tricholomella constricta TaxID=117010 RepID=A0A8H5HNA5_9AGAR|nr:hypothetical protein D9615_002630 [Tricholomella constricta]